MMDDVIKWRTAIDRLVTKWTEKRCHGMGALIVSMGIRTRWKCQWTSVRWTRSRLWESPIRDMVQKCQLNPIIVFIMIQISRWNFITGSLFLLNLFEVNMKMNQISYQSKIYQ